VKDLIDKDRMPEFYSTTECERQRLERARIADDARRVDALREFVAFAKRIAELAPPPERSTWSPNGIPAKPGVPYASNLIAKWGDDLKRWGI